MNNNPIGKTFTFTVGEIEVTVEKTMVGDKENTSKGLIDMDRKDVVTLRDYWYELGHILLALDCLHDDLDLMGRDAEDRIIPNIPEMMDCHIAIGARTFKGASTRSAMSATCGDSEAYFHISDLYHKNKGHIHAQMELDRAKGFRLAYTDEHVVERLLGSTGFAVFTRETEKNKGRLPAGNFDAGQDLWTEPGQELTGDNYQYPYRTARFLLSLVANIDDFLSDED